MRYFVALFSLVAVLAAQQARGPKHLFDPSAALTEPSGRQANLIAEDFLRSVADQYQLSTDDLGGVYLAKEYKTVHNGVTHLVYKQQFQGLDVVNAEWTVNIDAQGRVINAGGSLFGQPGQGVLPPAPASALAAVREAVISANRTLGDSFVPFEMATASPGKTVKFHRGALSSDIEGRAVWYGVKGILRPAWQFVVPGEKRWDHLLTVVESETNQVMSQENLTRYQNPPRALVFEKGSPQPNPTPGVQLTAPPPLVQRTLQPLTGDPAASPRGWVRGNQTSGNNAVAGENPMGVDFAPPQTTAAANGDFSFPLELGPGAPNPVNFTDAANANLFYWVNRAHDFFYSIGFDEAAGNYQAENFGRGGMGGDPLYAYSHYGTIADLSSELDNAFYYAMSLEDGSPAEIAMFLGTAGSEDFFTDGAYDADVILHEYTHGVSLRLVRELIGLHGGAMGEGWSDFFAMEIYTPEGSPADGVYPSGGYFDRQFTTGIRTRPYTTDTDINPLTYRDLGHVIPFAEVHADGEIWVEALWEARAALIKQFGEKEGRRRVRLLVIDGMKLSPPAPTFVDMRDAILLADRTDFNGASQKQLWDAFAKRGLGALAMHNGVDSVHILASFETPSPEASMRFYDEPYFHGEYVRLVLQDANNAAKNATVQFVSSSGDVETVQLRKTGSVFTGGIPTYTYDGTVREDGVLTLVPTDYISAYYTDFDTGNGAKQIAIWTPTLPDYYQRSVAGAGITMAQTTRLNLRSSSGAGAYYLLPFEFPFYSKKYSTVRVYSNGLLTFDGRPTGYCKDGSALASMRAMAPLWIDMRTDGRAQANEDVYVSRPSTDSIMFQWIGETNFAAAPDAVNFSVVLFRDGSFQFQYGAGNKNLSWSSSTGWYYGCPVASPVVGISNGNETLLEIWGSYWGRATLENARPIVWDPPFGNSSLPAGKLESPADGDAVKGVLNIKGVAWDDASPITRVDFLIDDIWQGRTTASQSRADFCATQKVAGCPAVGFASSLSVDALNLQPGPHKLQIQLTNSRGGFVRFPESPVVFQVEAGQSMMPVGKIESPAEGEEVSGILVVQGYALVPGLRVGWVDVLIDGVNYGAATYGYSRSDACRATGISSPDCPYVGFRLPIDPQGSIVLSNGQHKLQIRVYDEAGRHTLLPDTPVSFTVNKPASKPPVGVLLAPQNGERLSGAYRIAGYAWAPDGRVRSVQLLIDDYYLYSGVRYGVARPDECAQLPDVTACPNIGFEYDLDTKRLLNGVHSLGIYVTDDQGNTAVFPRLIQGGINVVIDNQ